MTETVDSPGMQHAFPHVPKSSDDPPTSDTNTSSGDAHKELNPPHSPPTTETVTRATDGPVSSPSIAEHQFTPPPSSGSSQEEHRTLTIPQPSRSDEAVDRISVNSTSSKDVSRSSTGSPGHKDPSPVLLSGPKRTASGQVKRSSITSIYDLKPDNYVTRPSRTSSLRSTASSGSVMEVSFLYMSHYLLRC